MSNQAQYPASLKWDTTVDKKNTDVRIEAGGLKPQLIIIDVAIDKGDAKKVP
jgi:hypothetical protein